MATKKTYHKWKAELVDDKWAVKRRVTYLWGLFHIWHTFRVFDTHTQAVNFIERKQKDGSNL